MVFASYYSAKFVFYLTIKWHAVFSAIKDIGLAEVLVYPA